jgi:hypothetical protein
MHFLGRNANLYVLETQMKKEGGPYFQSVQAE